MDARLRGKIEEFDEKRVALLDEMEGLEEVTLQARPIEGKWSVLEIVEHLAVAEREVLGGLPEYEALAAQTQSFKNGVMYRVVMAVLKLGIPVKAPSKKMLPKNELSLAEIRKQWDESQKWVRGYVEGLDDEGLKKAVFSHPVSGPINIEQAIDMSLAHINSHIRQIRKRLELIG
jgi:uncharacterized damage-inducible protein DinB